MKEALKLSGIGRPLDFNCATNRAVFILSAAVSVAGFGCRMLRNGGTVQSLLWGLGAGAGVFLAWALGREVDPDHDLSAFTAAGLALVGIFLWGIPGLGLLFWLLAGVRIVNRTTGLAPTVVDSMVFIGLGGWMSFRGHWIAGLLTFAALFSDGFLPRGKRRQMIFAAMGAAVSAAGFILGGKGTGRAHISWEIGLVLLAAFLFLPVIMESRDMKSGMDESDEILISSRVQAAQSFAGLFLILTALWGGKAGLVPLIPAWAAVVGAGIRKRITSLKIAGGFGKR